MSAVLDWVKTNIASVIFIVVMIAALVAIPLVSGHLNAGVQETVKKRVGELKELEKLDETNVTIGNPVRGQQISEKVLVNEKLLGRLREVSIEERADAEEVQRAALQHNSKGRGVILPRLLPAPPPAERETLPEQFHRMLVTAYDDLLERVNAGSPPSAESMAEDLERKRAQFLSRTLQKSPDDPLTAEEAAQLREVLSTQRMSRYAEQAQRIGMYASAEALFVPAWFQADQPTMGEMYEWQWQYWVIEDILEALADANETSGSVQQAPVKRVLSVVVYEGGPTASAGSSGAGSPGMGAPGAGMGSRRPAGGGGADADAAAAASGVRAEPAKEVKLDFSVSFTGRMSNPLYDVRLVDLQLIVDSARLPAVLDAIARRNFMTVIDVDMMPADHYAEAQAGYFYGPAPISLVTLRIETIWLRSWMTPFMPDEVKFAMGVPLAPAPSGG